MIQHIIQFLDLAAYVEIPSSVTTKFRMGMTTTTIDIQLC
jgi:hypothetical protein